MDRDLIEAAQRGDQAAFVDLIRTRTDRLFAIAQRILRDVDRAEDALQDALVIAWRDLRDSAIRTGSMPGSHRLLVNVCIAQAARERRRTSNLRVLPVDGPAAPDELLSVADRDLLDRGFRRLAPDQRAILVLHHYLGLRPDRRSPRPSASRPARPDPDCSTPTAPCGPPSRRTRASSRQEVARHERRSRPQPPARRLVRRRPVQVADRVIDDTASRIARQRQLPAWRLRSWRFPTMSTPIKLVAIGAALLAVLVGGAVFMGGGSAPTSDPVRAPSPRPSHRRRHPSLHQRALCSRPGGPDEPPTGAGILPAGSHRPRPSGPVSHSVSRRAGSTILT